MLPNSLPGRSALVRGNRTSFFFRICRRLPRSTPRFVQEYII